jgi:hypothetical protein
MQQRAFSILLSLAHRLPILTSKFAGSQNTFVVVIVTPVVARFPSITHG